MYVRMYNVYMFIYLFYFVHGNMCVDGKGQTINKTHRSGKGDNDVTYTNFDLDYIFKGDREHAFSKKKGLVQQKHMDKERCGRKEDDEEDGRESKGVGFINLGNP